MNSRDLSSSRCQPGAGGFAPMACDTAQASLRPLPGWQLVGNTVEKSFVFTNHYEVMAFVNALAWISHRQNHHPELTLGEKYCRVRYSTHSIDELSENDFICASQVELLLQP